MTADTCTLKEKITQAASVIRSEIGDRAPVVGIVLGSGLGPLAEQIKNPVFIPFASVPFMKTSTCTGHVGRFVCGQLGEKCVLAMQGRLHGYEGNTSEQVAFPIWVMHALGIQTLITTNAAGAINASYNVGDFCIMTDHINFTGRNPVVGLEPNDVAFRFFSMQDAYDPHLRTLAYNIAKHENIPAHLGVYLGLLGPSFETPAEIRAFGIWGADTVAMSVCEEVIAARHVGMRVLGMSLCSNMACGVESTMASDLGKDVLEVANARSADFCKLVTCIVAEMN